MLSVRLIDLQSVIRPVVSALFWTHWFLTTFFESHLKNPYLVSVRWGSYKIYTRSSQMSEIIDFYRGKNILITGAAGFLGKLLMDKLLRLCDVGKIYIVVRDKKGLTAEQRLDSIFEVPVFDQLRQLKPNFLDHITLVKGDVSLPGIGLSEEGRTMLIEEVNIVFHAAATVNFEEPIKRSTMINVCGTKETTLLCQNMKHLEAFVHVSTAFSNCLNEKISEKFYDPPLKADELITLCSGMSNSEAFSATKKYLQGWPNTYAFTKCVAEDVIRTYASALPACIVRPSIVVCTKSEPIPGWIDNYYGPSGYIATVQAGLMRVALVDMGVTAEILPADMCVNAIVAAGHYIGNNKFVGETKIFNFTSSPRNRLSYENFCEYMMKAIREEPSNEAVWYPQLTLCKSSSLYSILSFAYHIIPAFILDIILIICLKRPKALKTSLKLERFIGALSYFTTRNFTFSNGNWISMWKGLNPTDKRLFAFDLNSIDWKEMIKIKVGGVRKHLFKQHERTISSARRRMVWLLVIDKALRICITLSIIYFVAKCFNLVNF